jgi:hypothetical protein
MHKSLLKLYSMKAISPQLFLSATAVLLLTFVLRSPALADTFGSGTNSFDIGFVQIGNPSNSAAVSTNANVNGYGSVPYEYRIGTYEISQGMVIKATASGLSGVTAATNWTGNRPAASINWYEAAAFVNWLNTSTGRQAAYDLSWNGSAWSMTLWNTNNAWTLGGTNLYRHKDAYYFLPSENEWFKAAYSNPGGTNYFLYATGSNTAPAIVTSGTNAGTAVYGGAANGVTGPAEVTLAGGLSPYGTMGQTGNLWEWMETSGNGLNDAATNNRAYRGGGYLADATTTRSTTRYDLAPTFQDTATGFRVASIPEPSTYALLLLGAGALFMWRRRAKF